MDNKQHNEEIFNYNSNVLQKKCFDLENSVSLLYINEILTPTEIEELRNILNEHKIKLDTYIKQNTIQNGIEEFLAEIYLTLSSNLWSSILLGVIANGVYDIIKKIISKLCKFVKKKKVLKITTKKTTNAAPKIFLKIEKATFVIPTELNENELIDYMDSLFNLLKLIDLSDTIYVYYNIDNKKFKIYTENELIKKLIKE